MKSEAASDGRLLNVATSTAAPLPVPSASHSRRPSSVSNRNWPLAAEAAGSAPETSETAPPATRPPPKPPAET